MISFWYDFNKKIEDMNGEVAWAVPGGFVRLTICPYGMRVYTDLDRETTLEEIHKRREFIVDSLVKVMEQRITLLEESL